MQIMRNIISTSLAPDPRDSAWGAAPPTKGLARLPRPYPWRQQLRHWSRKGVWLPDRPLLIFRSKIYGDVQSGPNNPSVIVNWEVVRSSEVRNVLSLWQVQSAL